MNRTLRSRSGYVLAGGVLSAALALTGTAVGVPHSGPAAAPTPTNRLTARPTKVKVKEEVTYSGRTTHIRDGATVRLQQLLSGKWSNVSGKTDTVRNDSYTIYDDFRYAGSKTMRTVVEIPRTRDVHSNTVHITVTNHNRHHRLHRR